MELLKKEEKSIKKNLWILFVISVWIYYIFWIFNLPAPLLHEDIEKDAWVYVQMAKNYIETGTMATGSNPSAWFLPGYPFYISIIFRLFGSVDLSIIRLAQFVLSFLSWLVFYNACLSIFERKTSRFISSLALVYIPFVWTSSLILTESLFILLFLVYVYFCNRLMVKRSSSLIAVLAGIILGLINYTRPTLAWSPLILLVSHAFQYKRLSKRNLLNWIVVLLMSLVMLLPWWVRNYQVFGKFIPFSLQGGEVVLGGTYQDYRFEPSTWPSGKNEWETDTLRSNLAKHRLKEWWKEDPRSLVSWYLKKVWMFWSAPYYREESFLPRYIFIYLFHWFVLLAGLMGAISGFLKKRHELNWLAYLLVFITLVHTLLVALDRYSMPFMYLWMLLIGMLTMRRKRL